MYWNVSYCLSCFSSFQTITIYNMDEIKDIIKSIVKGCNQGGVVVSEILAAFVAKTVSS